MMQSIRRESKSTDELFDESGLVPIICEGLNNATITLEYCLKRQSIAKHTQRELLRGVSVRRLGERNMSCLLLCGKCELSMVEIDVEGVKRRIQKVVNDLINTMEKMDFSRGDPHKQRERHRKAYHKWENKSKEKLKRLLKRLENEDEDIEVDTIPSKEEIFGIAYNE